MRVTAAKVGPVTATLRRAEADTQHPRTANHTVVGLLPTVGLAVRIMVHNMVAMGVVLRTTIRYVTGALASKSMNVVLFRHGSHGHLPA